MINVQTYQSRLNKSIKSFALWLSKRYIHKGLPNATIFLVFSAWLFAIALPYAWPVYAALLNGSRFTDTIARTNATGRILTPEPIVFVTVICTLIVVVSLASIVVTLAFLSGWFGLRVPGEVEYYQLPMLPKSSAVGTVAFFALLFVPVISRCVGITLSHLGWTSLTHFETVSACALLTIAASCGVVLTWHQPNGSIEQLTFRTCLLVNAALVVGFLERNRLPDQHALHYGVFALALAVWLLYMARRAPRYYREDCAGPWFLYFVFATSYMFLPIN